MNRCSRVPGFYKLPVDKRRQALGAEVGHADDLARLADGPLLDLETADHMIENVIGTYALPLGIGLNFRVNGKDYLVPMAVEEPSVVAAASNAARMVREGGGFEGESDPPIMISQVQLCEVPDCERAKERIESHGVEILERANAAQPGLVERGGGARGLEVRILEHSVAGAPGMMVVHLHVDCRDAMGANLVNTIAEAVAPRLAELADADVGLRILSNLADHRCAHVRCKVPVAMLATEGQHNGAQVAEGIVDASRFAELDPYRASTHNKGIMNGIDAAVLAVGNDWRGIEAGAHAYAARHGSYKPLATWRLSDDGVTLRNPRDRDDSPAAWLCGRMDVPMALGTVGGALRVHPGAKLSLGILGVESASELGLVLACVGMASNLAALRALASEGIQRGHMSLHARTVARGVGATGELVERVAEEMARTGDVRAVHAAQILERLRAENPKSNTSQGAVR